VLLSVFHKENEMPSSQIVKAFLERIAAPDSRCGWYNLDIALSRKGLVCHVPQTANELCDAGLIEIVSDQDSEGRDYAYYRLTDAGKKKLDSFEFS
jgi:hypothetical protein